MEDGFLVTCREIQKTRFITETITYRATHVSSPIVAFIKINVKLGCVQNIFVLRWNFCEISHFKVLQYTCRKKIRGKAFVHIYVVVTIHNAKVITFLQSCIV